MHHRSLTILLLALGVFAVASCSPQADSDPSTTTTVQSSTTTTTTATDSTTKPPTPPTTVQTLPPPTVGDPNDVALDAFLAVEGFEQIFDPTESDFQLADLADKWIPTEISNGLAAAIVENDTGTRVAVFSVIPLTGLRGHPWLADIYALWADEDAIEPTDPTAITEVTATTGGTFFLWGEGDGVIVTTSADPVAARSYLERRAELDTPNAVWSAGDCVYLPQDEPDVYGNAPWAPFPLDLAVPCSGPHNAEVLLAEFTGTDLAVYDGAQIAYDRSFLCDKAYADTFDRPQGEYLPSMITYMPDADEWERGDRYLACLVRISDVGGSDLLFEGSMADLPNLAVTLEPGMCTDDSGKRALNCGAAHRYQFVGAATFDGDSYSVLGQDLDETCERFGAETVAGSGTTAEVLITGFDPGPYQFELGYRTVNCYALAVSDFAVLDVTGSFFEKWSEVDEDAASA